VNAWGTPVSNVKSTIAFKQAIGANDALRTGAYSKTLTFTLSTRGSSRASRAAPGRR